MRIVFFGTYDEARHPRVRVLREGFTAHGDEVIVCNEPVRDSTARRVSILHQPWRVVGFLVLVFRSWMRLSRRARKLRPVDAVVVGYLGHLDVHLARRLWPRATIVLDHLVSLEETAVDRRSTRSWLRRLLAFLDRRALSKADVIVVDTDEARSLIPPARRDDTSVVPVGASREWFQQTPGQRDASLRVIFFGLFTPLQGAPVIGEAIALLAGQPITFTMVGDGQDLASTRAAARANAAVVDWIDWVRSEDLPELVSNHDVCLGIFGSDAKARRVTPTKAYLGAAAGCAVVTSDTVPQRRAFGDAAIFVEPGDAHALAEALRHLASDDRHLSRMRSAAADRAQADFEPRAVVRTLRDRMGRRAVNPALPPLSPNAWLRWDMIERALPRGARTFLEVGAGQGGVGSRLARRYEYTGVEPDETSCSVAASRVAGFGSMVQGTVDALAPDRTFDVVGAFEVLEHIDDDRAALTAWRERIRPGGWLLLSVPAHQRQFGAGDVRVGHFRRYERAELQRSLEETGFDHVEIWAVGFPLGFLLQRVRNVLAGSAPSETEPAEATASSGRQMQPSSRLSWATRAGTMPFRLLQRPFQRTDLCTGYVVRARRG